MMASVSALEIKKDRKRTGEFLVVLSLQDSN
jgi:hypothetical protein